MQIRDMFSPQTNRNSAVALTSQCEASSGWLSDPYTEMFQSVLRLAQCWKLMMTGFRNWVHGGPARTTGESRVSWPGAEEDYSI